MSKENPFFTTMGAFPQLGAGYYDAKPDVLGALRAHKNTGTLLPENFYQLMRQLNQPLRGSRHSLEESLAMLRENRTQRAEAMNELVPHGTAGMALVLRRVWGVAGHLDRDHSTLRFEPDDRIGMAKYLQRVLFEAADIVLGVHPHHSTMGRYGLYNLDEHQLLLKQTTTLVRDVRKATSLNHVEPLCKVIGRGIGTATQVYPHLIGVAYGKGLRSPEEIRKGVIPLVRTMAGLPLEAFLSLERNFYPQLGVFRQLQDVMSDPLPEHLFDLDERGQLVLLQADRLVGRNPLDDEMRKLRTPLSPIVGCPAGYGGMLSGPLGWLVAKLAL